MTILFIAAMSTLVAIPPLEPREAFVRELAPVDPDKDTYMYGQLSGSAMYMTLAVSVACLARRGMWDRHGLKVDKELMYNLMTEML